MPKWGGMEAAPVLKRIRTDLPCNQGRRLREPGYTLPAAHCVDTCLACVNSHHALPKGYESMVVSSSIDGQSTTKSRRVTRVVGIGAAFIALMAGLMMSTGVTPAKADTPGRTYNVMVKPNSALGSVRVLDGASPNVTAAQFLSGCVRMQSGQWAGTGATVRAGQRFTLMVFADSACRSARFWLGPYTTPSTNLANFWVELG